MYFYDAIRKFAASGIATAAAVICTVVGGLGIITAPISLSSVMWLLVIISAWKMISGARKNDGGSLADGAGLLRTAAIIKLVSSILTACIIFVVMLAAGAATMNAEAAVAIFIALGVMIIPLGLSIWFSAARLTFAKSLVASVNEGANRLRRAKLISVMSFINAGMCLLSVALPITLAAVFTSSAEFRQAVQNAIYELGPEYAKAAIMFSGVFIAILAAIIALSLLVDVAYHIFFGVLAVKFRRAVEGTEPRPTQTYGFNAYYEAPVYPSPENATADVGGAPTSEPAQPKYPQPPR